MALPTNCFQRPNDFTLGLSFGFLPSVIDLGGWRIRSEKQFGVLNLCRQPLFYSPFVSELKQLMTTHQQMYIIGSQRSISRKGEFPQETTPFSQLLFSFETGLVLTFSSLQFFFHHLQTQRRCEHSISTQL